MEISEIAPENGKMLVISAMQRHKQMYPKDTNKTAIKNPTKPASKPLPQAKYCPPTTIVIPTIKMI